MHFLYSYSNSLLHNIHSPLYTNKLQLKSMAFIFILKIINIDQA